MFMQNIFVSVCALASAVIAATYRGDEWDAICAGPAGIVVADRLSEAGLKTLLLEQGGPSYYITGGRARPDWLAGTNLSRVDVPGLYKSIFSSQDGLTCPEDVLRGFSACAVGGNTAINAGLFIQPPKDDWDRYFPDGWKSANVEDAVRKVRQRQPFTDLPSQDGRRYLQSGYEAAKEWLVDGAGFEEVNVNHVPDKKAKVFGHPVYNYEGGERSGPVKTYLQSALQRPNFSLMTSARVVRVVREGGTVTGVQVSVDSAPATTFNVCPENGGKVILSGGALLSPQLLMHSGIGDPVTLANLSRSGILDTEPGDWINNTAVGDKLFDNPNTFIVFSSPDVSSYSYSYSSPPQEDQQLYLTNRSGPYSFASQTSVFWDYVQQGDERVGLQGTIDSSGSIDWTGNDTITLNVYGTSGLRSFGKVILNDAGVSTDSTLRDFYYKDPRDAEAVATFIYNIFQALPASSLTPLSIAQNSTLEELTSWVSQRTEYTARNVLHWSSSCRIGSCVDNRAKVLGTENLYVVDASIVEPLTVNPTMGIMIAAERAVERILGRD